MFKVNLVHFDISQICNSGQCFRMNQIRDNTFCVIAGDRYLELEQRENLCIFSCDEIEFEQFWKHYFDLDTDYAIYMEEIDQDDDYLCKAAEIGTGIRILHQDLWEMIVSFLISQQNNILRIRKCIQNICEKYGEQKTNFRGEIYYAFPKPEALANLDEDALMACNLGYRSKYVVRTAKSFAEGEMKLAEISQMPYEEARLELLKLFGVGNKVADCICLFGLHHLQAFPIDTHIKQALDKHYPQGFPMKRYKGFEGVIQQYIFYFELLYG